MGSHLLAPSPLGGPKAARYKVLAVCPPAGDGLLPACLQQVVIGSQFMYE